MKINGRTVEEWHEIETVIFACDFHRNVFVRQEAELRRLLPELDEQVVSDIANGLCTINIKAEMKKNEVTEA